MFDITRHQARERALELLYESEQKGVSPRVTLEALGVAPEEYTRKLLDYVDGNADVIDSPIKDASQGWTIDRMPVVDLCVLRIAVAELLYEQDVPVAVVIDEAVELAKTYSTEESGKFVNGVLATIAAGIRN